jgi:hypothetical protein
MNWTYQQNELTEIPESFIGFVYLITNKQTGRMYIGKKNFYSTKTVQVNNKKKKKKVESDWKNYWSSSEELKKDVKELGADLFTREIIHLCKSKGVLNYLETKEIILRECLETDNYYNYWFSARVHQKHLRLLKNID